MPGKGRKGTRGSSRRRRSGKGDRQPRPAGTVVRVPEALMRAEWVDCPECGRRVKSRNLRGHALRVHRASLEVVVPKRRRAPRAAPVAAVVLILAIASYWAVSHRTESGTEGGSPGPGDDDWWTDYSPCASVGTGEEDWWYAYPEGHPDESVVPDHPGWVTGSLEDRVVLILDHSTDCAPCIQQQEDVERVLDTIGEHVEFYDILSDDERSGEVFDSYDPDGRQHYIPLTVVVTRYRDHRGDELVIWHSAEGATGERWLKDRLKDAIYYQRTSGEE